MIVSHRIRLWRLSLGFLAALVLALGFGGAQSPAPAMISTAIIQEILDSDEVFIETEKAEVEAVANFQQTISTEAARAGLLFSNGAAGRLAPNSKVTIGQCIELEQGSILAVGPANGCASGFEIGVEGTVYVLEIDAQGSAQVKVLEGSVVVKTDQVPPEEPAADPVEDAAAETTEEPVAEVTEEPAADAPEEPADAPEAASEGEGGAEIVVTEGQKLTIEAGGRPGLVEALLQEEVEAILYGALFDGFSLPLPGLSDLHSALERLYPDLDIPSYPGFGIPGPSLLGLSLPF